jgi:hypothetical protein
LVKMSVNVRSAWRLLGGSGEGSPGWVGDANRASVRSWAAMWMRSREDGTGVGV